ncbi:hypothetical protein B0E42_21200 [Pseudomonas sp. A25(2017)]|nr:hypothetical protein B0E42_21200 [Pseudomonas sp. A25(2017)]
MVLPKAAASSGAAAFSCLPQIPLWERACSRRRLHIQHQCKQTHRLREQARSHRINRDPETIFIQLDPKKTVPSAVTAMAV